MPRSPISHLVDVNLPMDVPAQAGWRVVVLPDGTVVVSALWQVAALEVASNGGAPRGLTPSARWRSAVMACTLGGLVERIVDDVGPDGSPGGQHVFVDADGHGNLLLFDAEQPAPLVRFGPGGKPAAVIRARMLEPEADIALTGDGGLWWAAPIPELPVQRFDADGEPVPGFRLQPPDDALGFVPGSISLDNSQRLWMSGAAQGVPRVLAFDQAGACVSGVFPPPDEPEVAATHLRVDHKQRLWLAEPSRQRLSVWQLSEQAPRRLGTLLAEELGLLAFAPRRVAVRAGMLLHVIQPGEAEGVADSPCLRLWSVRD